MATKKHAPAPVDKKSAVTPLKKITVSSVYGKVKVKDIPESGELPICRVSGVASGTESGTSDYGAWCALTGEFAAANLDTGESFVSPVAFIPGAMGDALVQSMESALREDATSRLKFVVSISVKVSPRDENKYEYIVRPVMENEFKNEALALLAYEPD